MDTEFRINPLVPNAFFLYPLTTLGVGGGGGGIEKGCVRNKWINLKQNISAANSSWPDTSWYIIYANFCHFQVLKSKKSIKYSRVTIDTNLMLKRNFIDLTNVNWSWVLKTVTLKLFWHKVSKKLRKKVNGNSATVSIFKFKHLHS